MRHLTPILLMIPALSPATGAERKHWNEAALSISRQCAECHRKEYDQWAGSDHAWAWRHTNEKLDAEAFCGQRIKAHGMELEMLRAIQSIATPFLDVLFEAITILGEQTVVILALAIAYWMYDKKFGEELAFTLLLSGLVNNLIKGIV